MHRDDYCGGSIFATGDSGPQRTIDWHLEVDKHDKEETCLTISESVDTYEQSPADYEVLDKARKTLKGVFSWLNPKVDNAWDIDLGTFYEDAERWFREDVSNKKVLSDHKKLISGKTSVSPKINIETLWPFGKGKPPRYKATVVCRVFLHSVKRKKERIRIPKEIEAELLFKNEHTCCVCMERGKDVQIHHIDEDPSNNDPANLIVSCLDCHSKASGDGGLGQSYKPKELELYKQTWEQLCKDRRSLKSSTSKEDLERVTPTPSLSPRWSTKHFSPTPTPHEIHDKLKYARPADLDAICSSYHGEKVQWFVALQSYESDMGNATVKRGFAELVHITFPVDLVLNQASSAI